MQCGQYRFWGIVLIRILYCIRLVSGFLANLQTNVRKMQFPPKTSADRGLEID
jgi:hypothetical protein